MARPQVLFEHRDHGYALTLSPAWLPAPEADALFAWLLAAAPFERETTKIFGRAVTVRRESCAFGDPGLTYRYSGVQRDARPWPAPLAALRERLHQELRTRFGFVLCNHYPDGAAGLGWHADDEADLVRDAPIAALSLGAERAFAVRPREGDRKAVTTPLPHGSLVVMEGSFQRFLQHRIPPRRRCLAARVSLTFRCMR